MYHFVELVRDWIGDIAELMPWDLEERLDTNPELLLVDVREPSEFEAFHIANSICAPRGILESCATWDFVETIPELAQAHKRELIVVCRSGHRSLLAAKSLEILGFNNVASLKTGVKGWNDYDGKMINTSGDIVDPDWVDEVLTPMLREEQLNPQRRTSID